MHQLHAIRPGRALSDNPYAGWPSCGDAALAALYDNNSAPRNQRDLAALRVLSAQAHAAPLRWRTHGLLGGAHGQVDVALPAGAAAAPALLFVHGGRWRMNTSRETAFWASAATAAGWAFVGLNFPKLGEVSLSAQVQAVQDRIAAVFANAAALGLDAERCVLAGHSSGAHLALAAALDLSGRAAHGAAWLPRLRALYLLGGMYDLRPLAQCTPADALGFDADEAARMSPLLALHASAGFTLPPVLVGVGAQESSEFVRQARALHWALNLNATCAWQSVEGAAHFDAPLEFNRPQSHARSFVHTALAAEVA
jgi:arylformamidase